MNSIEHGHGVFFLDPHGDGITDLLKRGDSRLIVDSWLFDPQDERYSFGINLLSCRNVDSLTDRQQNAAGLSHRSRHKRRQVIVGLWGREMHFSNKISRLQSIGLREAVRIIVKRLLQRLLLGKGLFSGGRFDFFEKFGVHVLPVHYYSPVPDTRELRKNLDKWYREWSFTGVNFDMESQLQILDNLRAYKRECDDLRPYNDPFLHELGEGFGEVESHILHAMIRRLKPRNVIEVGSGMSTFFSVNALSRNNEEAGIAATMTCIEPYPRPALHKVNGACEMRIIPKLVQEVSVEVFEVLSGGDILFIDSSHMVKINSDVNYLYLEVLPRLAEGVVVHIHDICFPYPTPPPEYWILTQHQFWTEAALVQAFLIFNSAFKVLLCSSYLHYKAAEALYSAFSFPKYDMGVPASLWLQKVH